MNVVVLGAGVVGVATAYYLVRSGHSVTVIDRRQGPALEASQANAGCICPGFSGPWASPALLTKAPGWLLRQNAPLAFGRGARWADIGWLLGFVSNCRGDAFRRNKERIQRVAHYSRRCFDELNRELGWGDNYDFRATGVIQLFREPRDVDNARRRALPVLARSGAAHQLLDAKALAQVEPALAERSGDFPGALFLPGDASGDSHKFATAMTEWLRAHGVDFRFDCTITGLESNGEAITGVRTASGDNLSADAYILAAGAEAAALLRDVGLPATIRPIKGYALTARLKEPAKAPHLAVMDETHKTMIARLGDRIRIAGMAEISGFDKSTPERRRLFLQERLEAVYPGIADFTDAHFQAELRPMTWDGPPILGATPLQGLLLNIGHGSGGWTQSCGTGRVLADLVSGRTPEIDLTGLTIERFLTRIIPHVH